MSVTTKAKFRESQPLPFAKHYAPFAPIVLLRRFGVRSPSELFVGGGHASTASVALCLIRGKRDVGLAKLTIS